ncbi:MAG: mannonate dehydratase [Chitinophagaceae bacterium]
MTSLHQTFRWFGPNDAVPLQHIRQTGATGIVTALHEIPCGEVWPVEEIQRRQKIIEGAGLKWSVVESVNVHESIKTGTTDRDKYIDNYITTLRNLAGCGLSIVCYNFMPVLDWTRTELEHLLPNEAKTLRYDARALAAFELFILRREGVEKEFTPEQQQNAFDYYQTLPDQERTRLTNTIMAGLPGTDDVFTIEEFMVHLEVYKEIGAPQLKDNLAYFLRAIIPFAEATGIKMCIHPDDPPFPILGLPRVVSTEQDLKEVTEMVASPNNGLTFCTGSLGARGDNDLPGIVERLGDKFHFIHLRNVHRESDGSFFEADHLGGSTDMYAVMKNIIIEQQKRLAAGREDVAMPMRPDHGHQMLDDLQKKTYPGYSAIGRLKGLAELRGLEMGIRRSI